MCTFTINSNAPGTFTANASVTYAVAPGQTLTRNTAANSGPGGTDSALKKYANVRIQITPGTATNAVGISHTFTVTLQGTLDGTNWNPITNTVINESIANSLGANGTITGGTCVTPGSTNASGQCTIIITSSSAGQSSVSAVAPSVSYAGQTFTNVTTDGTLPNSGPGVKTWKDLRISITPQDDTNRGNDSHTFTVTVEQSRATTCGQVCRG